jgi:predicted porin
VDSTWRVGRRHALKLSYTQLSRENPAKTLERDFVWGGQTYNAGLTASSTSGANVLGGYYRFAIVRNDRFEIGPSLGVGYLALDAGIKATGTVGGQSRSLDRSTSMGSITGAVGGYATGRPAKNLALHADYLYIKVTLENETASVTDWRLAADYYFSRNVGVGAQYKYNKYSQARGALSTELGGELIFQGGQVFLTFRF